MLWQIAKQIKNAPTACIAILADPEIESFSPLVLSLFYAWKHMPHWPKP